MATHYKIWILALTSSLIAAPALAYDDDLGESEGPYLFVTAGGNSGLHLCASPNQPNPATCHSLTVGFRGGLGYQYTPMWGLEVNYGSFGRAYSDGFANFGAPVGSGNYAWEMKAQGMAIQGVATLHMGDDLAVFGKFGLARVEYDEFLGIASQATGNWVLINPVHAAKNTAALGAGIRYDVTPHGTIFVIYENFGSYNVYNLPVQYTVSLNMVSAGLMYRY